MPVSSDTIDTTIPPKARRAAFTIIMLYAFLQPIQLPVILIFMSGATAIDSFGRDYVWDVSNVHRVQNERHRPQMITHDEQRKDSRVNAS